MNQPKVVLDTNVVLDAVVFAHPAGLQLLQAIEAKQLQWIGTQAMQEELSRVLDYRLIQVHQPDEKNIQAIWQRWCHMMVQPTPALMGACQCTDRDDQKFIDLALAHAQYLLSRDRAVLKLARQAKRLGVLIMTPECFITRAIEKTPHPIMG
jgi:putative PIN family toxin of toxin-antitoxin system